jgi:hypothetical protein
VRRRYVKTEEAVLASQTRLMLSQAQALTAGQGPAWLGNFLNKHGLKPVVQDWLNDSGLRMVEYSILMNFGRMLEQVLFTYRGQELSQELEKLLLQWCSKGMDHVKIQRLAVHCWDTLAAKARINARRTRADRPGEQEADTRGRDSPREQAEALLRSGTRNRDQTGQ